MISSESEARAFCAERCDAGAMERLEAFVEVLAAENQRQNLVASKTLETVWQRHFADSAQLLDHVSRETSSLMDLGTGAGFPGLILAIMRPHWDSHLVESRRIRHEWLASTVKALGLSNCNVQGVKLEKVQTAEIGAITARAFAPLPKLLDLSARFSTPSTAWLLPKGRSAAQELSQLPAHTRRMFHVEQSVTDAEAGILVGKGRPTAL